MARPTPSNPQLIFAGGGTGGHIYPALAIAEHARAIEPGVGVRVLCSTRAVDAEILSQEGTPFTTIPARPPIARPAAALRFAASWLPAVNACKRAIREHRSAGPVTLVAMGGFVCAPAVAAARSLGVSVVLVNLDAVPGKANRHAARHAERVFTACRVDNASVASDWTEVGPVVRRAFTDAGDDPDAARVSEARRAFGLDADTRTLLVTGGSQGATSINDLMRSMLEHHTDTFAGWQVIHQIGRHHEPDAVRPWYEHAGVNVWVDRFISKAPRDMATAWLASDLSIGRCGAGTVAEAWATRTPAVFFPYPYHADGHQKANAQPLVRAGSALVLDDRVSADDNLAAHGEVLGGLLADPARLAALAEPAKRLPPVDGARRIARAILPED